MKIIRCDNFNRETVSEGLVAENIKYEREAQIMLKALQDSAHNNSPDWYRLEQDDYVLYKWEP